jgi:hypothetical protein
VLVERVQEGRTRVGQKMLQRASTNHCASVGLAIEAFDNRHVCFQCPYHIAQSDGFGVTRQADAPALALDAVDVAKLGQTVHNLHEMVP